MAALQAAQEEGARGLRDVIDLPEGVSVIYTQRIQVY